MNRAEMLEAALRRIATTDVDAQRARIIATQALDTDYPWPGEAQYNHPKDFAIAHEWMNRHVKADEIVFVKGRAIVALYYEPVANHYQQARKLFCEFAERLRETFEADWI